MADRWFYRSFGKELGPVTFERLRQLVRNGTLWDADEVRSGDSGSWVSVSSMNWTESNGEKDLKSDKATSPAETVADNLTGSANSSVWYCLIGDAELGPWTFNELALFAESRQLSADDQVKMGENGKWRKVGSIGRLVALLPYDADDSHSGQKRGKLEDGAIEFFPISEGGDSIPLHNSVSELLSPKAMKDRESMEDQEVPLIEEMSFLEQLLPAASAEVVKRVEVNIEAAEQDNKHAKDQRIAPQAAPVAPQPHQDVYQQATALIAQKMLAQADAVYKVSEEQATALIAWADGPDVDRFWYGWAGGVEFGPVEFSQVFGLAKSGQLKPTDFIRNGEFSQFTPSLNVPGLFAAVAMINKAAETLSLAKSQILTVTSSAT